MADIFVRSRPTTNWAASTAYSLGDRRKATAAARGIHFEVTTAGTSDGSEPTWNTTVGGTTSDGTVTWTTRGSANAWVANTAYVAGDRVHATASATAARQNYVYECTTGGTSHATTEPTWVTTTPDTSTTTDNTVTWTLRKCSTWNNAHPFLGRIFGDTSGTGKTAAGDTVYVSHTHSETSSLSYFITSVGTATNPVNIWCVNDVGDPASPGTAATTAVVGGTATSSTIMLDGFAHAYGITFSAGTGSSNASLNANNNTGSFGWRFEACTLKLNTTSTSANTVFGTTNANRTCKIELENTVMQFGAAGQSVRFAACEFSWHNTASAIAGTAPTTLFVQDSVNRHHNVSVHGVDLSAITGNLMSVAVNVAGAVYTFANCKLGSGFTFTTGTHTGIGGPEVNFINCDSGSTNYNYYRETAQGTIVDEVTLVKTSGASDGTTPLAWKAVTNANPKFGWPLASHPIVAWNDNSGSSKTATVEILHDSATNLTDGEMWVEVDYLANSGNPGGLAVSDRKASPVAAAVDQAASSVTWTTTGMANPNKQALSVTFTPQKKGAVRARVMLAKASKTVYINPQVTIT